MKRYLLMSSHVLLAGALVLAFAGCPRPNPQETPAKVFVLLTAGSQDASKMRKAAVPVEDIESLTVTVTKVSLVPAGDVEEPEGEGLAAKGGNESHPVLFEGSMDVNILDLTDVSAVLSSSEVKPGTYAQIRLEIENPRLVLASDPETAITDIQLTANGRLFISGEFEIPEGENQLLVLSFGGIHLVETGSGKYVLTPQLRADLEVSDANAVAAGTIAEIDNAAGTMVVTLADGSTVDVTYVGAVVWLPGDTDAATGTEADVAVGVEVEVQGLLDVYGTLTAQNIRIQAIQTQLSGTIASIDTATGTFMLTLADTSTVNVGYVGSVIFLPTDTDTATGTEADLAVDLIVDVEGTLSVGGAMTADTIHIQAPPEPPAP